MLARTMLRVFVPEKADRKDLYARKLPGIISRLRAAEVISKEIGLIQKNVFSLSSGIFVREYRKNLAIMKLVSHALFRLEENGWIKVFPDRIYYLKEKTIPGTTLPEPEAIFDALAETIKEIASIFESPSATKSSWEIRQKCKKYFRSVENLQEAEAKEAARPRTFWQRHDFSPLTKRAAMDIAASGKFYEDNKKVFESTAEDNIIRSGDEKIDELRLKEAQNFDQDLKSDVDRSKELSGFELRRAFSLGSADRSSLFPGRIAPELLSDAAAIYKLLEKETHEYDITYVISDLHMQDYLHRDIYELLRLFHVIAATGGTLVINGDFLDTWRAGSLVQILKSNKLIFDALSKINRVILIKGNHDEWLSLFNNQKLLLNNVSVVDRFTAKNLHIEHGNRFDVFNSSVSWIGRLATKAVNVLEKNNYIGPQLLTWTEYVGKRILSNKAWAEQKVDRVFNAIKQIYLERDPKEEPYSATNPLNVVLGHFHFPGLYHAYEKVKERIDNDEDLKGKVRFYLTDSWYNSEGYAGQVTVFAKKKDSETGQLLTSSFLWEYIDAMRILTLYGAWKL